jgi:hypothetical protein
MHAVDASLLTVCEIVGALVSLIGLLTLRTMREPQQV